MNELDGQINLFGQDSSSGKMSETHSAAIPQALPPARTSGSSWRRSSELRYITLMSLDLTPGAGDLLGRSYWEDISPWRGGSWMLNSGPAPRSGDAGCLLSQILLEVVPRRYYLSRRACRGILTRSKRRGKPLPPQLELAALLQAGLVHPPPTVPVSLLLRTARWVPVREILSLLKTPERCRYVLEQVDNGNGHSLTAGFSAGAGSSAGSIGYQEEVAPTLKGSPSGSMMPSVLCLNDQGGESMACSEDVAGTLRAQEHGHQPLVLYENHGVDARYRGPLSAAPTLSARAGTGGLNTPLVSTFGQQRTDAYRESDVASTESARQHKSATDLVLQPGKNSDDEPEYLLIRRLLPHEAELLQGFPPDWTAFPGASDSARFRALGNSVPIPCVEYLMQGIALVLRAGL